MLVTQYFGGPKGWQGACAGRGRGLDGWVCRRPAEGWRGGGAQRPQALGSPGTLSGASIGSLLLVAPSRLGLHAGVVPASVGAADGCLHASSDAPMLMRTCLPRAPARHDRPAARRGSPRALQHRVHQQRRQAGRPRCGAAAGDHGGPDHGALTEEGLAVWPGWTPQRCRGPRRRRAPLKAPRLWCCSRWRHRPHAVSGPRGARPCCAACRPQGRRRVRCRCGLHVLLFHMRVLNCLLLCVTLIRLYDRGAWVYRGAQPAHATQAATAGGHRGSMSDRCPRPANAAGWYPDSAGQHAAGTPRHCGFFNPPAISIRPQHRRSRSRAPSTQHVAHPEPPRPHPCGEWTGMHETAPLKVLPACPPRAHSFGSGRGRPAGRGPHCGVCGPGCAGACWSR
jgi:hypothetical protein